MVTATGIFSTIMFLVRLLVYTLIFIFFDDISNVLSHDFPLLSNIVIQVREDKFIKIEHILFGNKYIYVINSKCYYGYLCANADDGKWLLYRKDKLIHLDNPLKINEKRVRILANLLDETMDNFVNVVFLSRPVVVSKMVVSKPGELILLEKNFARRIEKYEKKCVLNSFSSKSIEEATQKIYDYHLESMENFKKIENKSIIK